MRLCLYPGDRVGPITINDASVSYTGTGQPDACLEILNRHVYSVPEEQCHPKPCSVGSVYQPTIPVEEEFFAVSAFVYTYETLGFMQEGTGVATPAQLQAKAVEFCMKVGMIKKIAVQTLLLLLLMLLLLLLPHLLLLLPQKGI